MGMSHRLQAVLVAAIWGVNFVAIEMGLRDLPPLLLTALRFAVVAVPLVFLVPRPTARARYVIAYGLILGVLKFGALFSALALGMGAGLGSLVLQAQALVSVLLAALLLR
ncbi:EamA family transporter, partial [Micromonospora azadirachtae]